MSLLFISGSFCMLIYLQNRSETFTDAFAVEVIMSEGDLLYVIEISKFYFALQTY